MNKQDLIKFEAHIAKRFDAGELPYLIHFSGGNEDALIEVFREIQPDDWVFSTHRSHYHYLLHGGSPVRLEHLIQTGRSMFVFDKALNFYASSIVAGTPAIAAGVAWALKRKGSDRRVWCFVGDGAEDEGHLYEAARYVDGHQLPCRFVIEDNDRSIVTSVRERWGVNSVRLDDMFDCVQRYKYNPTWPHGGSGTSGWLKFTCEPEIHDGSKLIDCVMKICACDGVESMTYAKAIRQSMEMLAGHGVIFIGYNVRATAAYGTLTGVHEAQRLETPVAENLMAGLAMGMVLEGFRPVLFFERHDFIYNALDALCNQLDKIETLSQGEFRMPVIIRAVAGSVKPFYAGLTHTSDLTGLFRQLFHFPILAPSSAVEVLAAYKMAARTDGPIMICERKELYSE